MSLTSIGDLAQSFVLQRQSAAMKSEMGRLNVQLSSGQVADVSDHLDGNFGHLADIERDLSLLETFRTTTEEARTFTGTMQTALGQVQGRAEALGRDAILTADAPGNADLGLVAAQARGSLDTIVTALNTDVAGRALFSGNAVDRAPLVPAGDLLSAARAAVAGVTDAAGLRSTLETFFNGPGGGFETLVYQGGTADLAPYRLGEGASVDLALRADAQPVRDTLRHAVTAALANDAALPLTDPARRALVRESGEGLLAAGRALTGMSAGLGATEARIDESASRIAAELTSLDLARSELVAADPFETATRLEEVQFQLETLYTLTARAARLNLASFLS